MWTENKVALSERCLRVEDSFAEAYGVLRDEGLSALPVFQGEKMVGIFCRETIFQFGPYELPWETEIGNLMNSSYLLIPETFSLEEVCKAEVDYLVVQGVNGKGFSVLSSQELDRMSASETFNRFKQLEGILDYTHNGVVAVDYNGKVMYFNQAAEEIIRRKKEDVLGKHLSEVIIPLGLLDVLETGEPLLCHKFSVDFSRETRIYITHRTPIFEEGQVVGAVGVFQDISEIESISQELDTVKGLYEELEALIECSFDGIMICDAKGLILHANSASEGFFGLGKKELLEKSLSEILQTGINADLFVKKAINSSNSRNCVINMGERQLLLTASPVPTSRGQIEKVIINARDLTELNSLRLQLQNTMDLTERYHSELSELRNRLLEQDGILVQSKKMQGVVNLGLRVAQVDSTVLITGETGVGKEIVTKIIHKNSKRKDGPFIKINCGAIPENLLESELFGYEPGAFTGASRQGKLGMFELAHQGTLFLDEIGELPLFLQVKLLRTIQEREVIRVGGNKPRFIDVRIIVATNRNLVEMVEDGSFREDLYFRLNVIPIHVPPLRDRQEEIIPLARQFMDKFCKAYDLEKELSPEVIDALLDYQWPGNIRELENVIERLVVTTPERVISFNDLPRFFIGDQSFSKTAISVKGLMPLRRAVLEVEKLLLEKAMERYGNTYKAAEVLQVDQSTVVRKLHRAREITVVK